jgi:hypothetical protein
MPQPGLTSAFSSSLSLQAAGRLRAGMSSFLLSSFKIVSPESLVYTKSEKLVDSSKTNSISLRNNVTAVSNVKRCCSTEQTSAEGAGNK